MKILLLAALLFLPAVTQAADVYGPVQAQAADFNFQGMHFGDSPYEDMICIRGPCSDAPWSIDHNSEVDLLTSYRRTRDLSFLGLVGISSPRYDFFDNRLVRVMFSLDCRQDSAEVCTEAVLSFFDRRFGIVPGEENQRAISADRDRVSVYRMFSDVILTVHHATPETRRRNAFIRIYDEELMNELRTRANPNYGH